MVPVMDSSYWTTVCLMTNLEINVKKHKYGDHVQKTPLDSPLLR